MSNYLHNRLERVEKRIFRIINCERKFPSLFSVADKMCQNLFNKVAHDVRHPLTHFLAIILTVVLEISALYANRNVKLSVSPRAL